MKEWWVYLVYDGNELLYVGCTGGLDRRLRDHQGALWWPDNPEVHLHGPYATKQEATHQERWAIKRFEPKLNRTDAWRWRKGMVWK